MKKKLLALTLAAIMACSLLAPPALAAEAELTCHRADGGINVEIPAGKLMGRGVLQLAIYSAQGQLADFKSVIVDDLAQGYAGTISTKTEPGGEFKAFLTGEDTYRPMVENAKGHLPEDPKADPNCLLTVTKGVKFYTDSSKVWEDKCTDEYVGVDRDPQIGFYVNENCQGNVPVDTKAGDVAKLYDTDKNGKVDAVYITRYQVARLVAPVRTMTNSNGIDTIAIPGVTTGFIPVAQVKGPYASLKQGDVVLFYTNRLTGLATSDDMVTVEIPETVTGKITCVDSKGRSTVNGTVYPATGITGGTWHTANTMWNWNDFENEYTFYLDKNGGICYDIPVTDPTTAGNVAVVLESRWVPRVTLDSSDYLQAKLLLGNGDVIIAPIDKVGVEIDGSILKCQPTDREVEPSRADRRVSYWTITGDASGDLTGSLTSADGFWHYQINEQGNYELTNLSLEQENFDGLIQIPAGQRVDPKPMFIGGEHANYANSSTLFLVEKYDAATDSSIFETFSGYINVPAMAEEDMLGGVCIHRRDVTHPTYVYPAAQYVYLKTTGYTTPAPRPDPPTGPEDLPEGLVFRVNGEYGRDADNYTIEVLDSKTGARTTLVVDSLSYVSDKLEMYTVDAISDGVVTAMTKITQSDADKGVTVGELAVIGYGVVTFEGGRTFQYDEEKTICILIDLKTTPANGTTVSDSYIIDPNSGVDMDPNIYQEGAKLYVIADGDDLAHYVYIVRMLNVE